jgi:steroid delta-isomerase-like uncharacterized protein
MDVRSATRLVQCVPPGKSFPSSPIASVIVLLALSAFVRVPRLRHLLLRLRDFAARYADCCVGAPLSDGHSRIMMGPHANANAPRQTGGMCMTATTNDSLVRSLYTIFNERAFDRIGENITDDFSMTNVATGETFQGAAGIRQFMQGWIDAFPEARAELSNVVIGDDGACVEFRGLGTHTGTFRTPMGDIAPTGKSVDIPFCDVHRIRDGKIAESRTYFDTGAVMRQLGLAQ